VLKTKKIIAKFIQIFSFHLLFESVCSD